MTLRFRSILYAGLCGSPAVSNHLSLRLYLRPWLSPCKYSQQQLQKPRYQQHIRWLSTEGDVLGSRGFGSPGPSGVSNGPPPLPEFRNLPSQKESRRPNLIKKFSAAMDHLQTAMFTAGQKLNEITGYSEIEALKKSIEQQGSFCLPVSRCHLFSCAFPFFFSKFSTNIDGFPFFPTRLNLDKCDI